MVAMVLLCGCPAFDYESGRWGCDTDADCPEGHSCEVGRHACLPDDGGGSGGGGDGSCSRGCENVLACSDEWTREDCELGCNAAGVPCEECLNRSNSCPALFYCQEICFGSGGAG